MYWIHCLKVYPEPRGWISQHWGLAVFPVKCLLYLPEDSVRVHPNNMLLKEQIPSVLQHLNLGPVTQSSWSTSSDYSETYTLGGRNAKTKRFSRKFKQVWHSAFTCYTHFILPISIHYLYPPEIEAFKDAVFIRSVVVGSFQSLGCDLLGSSPALLLLTVMKSSVNSFNLLNVLILWQIKEKW